jgi:hypothetical protein
MVSPNSSFVKPTGTDDPGFLRCVSKIINSLVRRNSPKLVVLVSIDNWFDHKWLGFEGKELGAVAVRWNFPYNIPPFHPNRVMAQSSFLRVGPGKYEPIVSPPLHRKQTAQSQRGMHPSL